MNKELASEELDRKLSFERTSGSIYDVVEAAVGNKKIEFTTFHHEIKQTCGTYSAGNYIHKSRISFQKICGASTDEIEIEVKNFAKNNRIVKCNLGHEHKNEEYEFHEWQRFVLGWEQMEQLIEWFQNGRFYDSRTRQAKKRNAKEGFHSKEKVK